MSTKKSYAEKVRTGNQMYGNGQRCCAHGIRTISNQLPPHNKDVVKWQVPVAERSDSVKAKRR